MRPLTPGVPRAGRIRAYLAGLVVTLGLGGVAMRAWALQVDEGDRYRAQAERQHATRVEIPAPRGDVIDTKGRPLAVSADVDSIWANPHDVRDVAATADKLAAIVGADPRALEAKLAGDRRFVWIDRHVAADVADRVRKAKLPGIEVSREPRRWYPARSIAGPVIGRSDIDGKGLDGIELAMNDLLAGRRASSSAVRDARGRALFEDGIAPAEPGATVRLSLDRSIQAIADDALADAVTTHKAKSGVVVVLEVATSRVLAMASYPTSDPNAEGAPARNRAVTDAYEAGSVMKVFSIAAALEAGTVTPDTEFDIHNGQYKVGPKIIRDVEEDKYLTVGGILKRSSNVGAAQIALQLGRDKLSAALARFGFGKKTGVELPGEQAGTVRPGETWRDIETATIAYGYGLTVTPLQIAAALAAIGNDGMYREPRIVDEVDDADGTVLYRAAGEIRRVVSARTAHQMQQMLISVFDKGKNGGTAHNIDVPGFKCGGKTGTAHKYDPETHKYAPDRYLSSFAGLAPADHPRLAIVVLVDDPSGGDYYGGKVAGPVFAVVASEALRYLGVPGDPIATLASADSQPEARSPKPEAPLAEGEFLGLGMARAIEVAKQKGLEVEIEGSGWVAAQEVIAPGKIRLRFSDERRGISGAR